MGDFKIRKNHVYVGNTDKVLEWSGFKPVDDTTEATTEEKKKLVSQVRERIKNYLQLDHVNFLFGTGSSIHLGAASIQNIPLQVEKDIEEAQDNELKKDFKKYIQALQRSLFDQYSPETDKKFDGAHNWPLISDGTYIRNYKEEEDANGKHYDDILLPFELLLNYLTAMLFQREAEKNETESKRLQKLINALKESLFGICDVHERTTNTKDLKRIKDKGYEEEFNRNKYLFHEKFLKSLTQLIEPCNLKYLTTFSIRRTFPDVVVPG